MVFENFQEEVIEALAIVDSNIWHLLSDKSIRKFMAKSNSVGLQSSLDPEISYNRARLNVYHIAYLKESLVLSTNEGVFRVILDTNQVIHHIEDHLRIASYLLHQVTGIYYNFDEVQTFVSGDERSSRDGTAIYLRFSTPTGIAVSDSSNF